MEAIEEQVVVDLVDLRQAMEIVLLEQEEREHHIREALEEELFLKAVVLILRLDQEVILVEKVEME